MGNRRPRHHDADRAPRLRLTPPDVRPTAPIRLGGSVHTATCPGQPMWDMITPHLDLDGTINAALPLEKTVAVCTFLAACLDEQAITEYQAALGAGLTDHRKTMEAAARLIHDWWPLITLSC
jgi:hypothetical protein